MERPEDKKAPQKGFNQGKESGLGKQSTPGGVSQEKWKNSQNTQKNLDAEKKEKMPMHTATKGMDKNV